MSSPLPDLYLGHVNAGFPVVQAALSGYSDYAMRAIARPARGRPIRLCEVVLDRIVLADQAQGKGCSFNARRR